MKTKSKNWNRYDNKNAKVEAVIKNGAVSLNIVSDEKISVKDLELLNGTMDIELHASKKYSCPWQDNGKCIKGFYLGKPVRLWGVKKFV